ncbi:MAG: hypothetical protein GX895_06840, partial [Clostridiales bacterium]|nr:hypothetical protein [Clostridiales bacterium]
TIVTELIEFAHLYLPAFDYGFGWLIPALIGFIIGLLSSRILSKGKKEYAYN